MTPQTREKIKVLLLENIHPLARQIFEAEGCEVETTVGALTPEQLISKIPGFHILGIRSKTTITAEVFAAAESLVTLGAFCIGTNHIDLKAARKHGIPVFNAPFGNTRSVAEMAVAEIIMLSRKLGDRNNEVHQGIWTKSHEGCYEVRGKTVGIVGYGNIGTQVSTLAEALGMRVLFYDIVPKLPRGNAKGCATLNHVLKESDFVSLHVPATPLTHEMISTEQFQVMKPGSYLLNAARGSVVDIPALIEALKKGPLAGAAIDVFPSEPEINTKDFHTELQRLPNVILTPHVGGATEEAQTNIGEEVPTALVRHLLTGSTVRSVNFPEMDVAPTENTHRILNVHRNVPGVLREINRIVSDLGANIEAQHLATDPELGYLVLDINREISNDVKLAIEKLKTSVKTRILY
ncbi:MAG TPA: phosphoglycerate dehydrogenase [Bdellovibrionales bacterium]|nr:MAG: D-3-phosphoglycerate dehydrogenase [Bdellovibrionales bacterium GWB1_52_6]OFZ06186.1 MAG: D-3-phosphoglycerate dehydrogenase [Bdellovibrionales bacterium GWA1_52_35]OFZ40157.1 MAG: D-3-phosphoglycerate dehydrogenase [Bdellovibrionales bacterium GWC1_52_8]HAR41398.1 phosphoglycerate dehydrogenase [Bdellovibrionales bacterium]HCM41171.1 phosphoglycerate dehydrogenase [Bdellovibrionales bacterium]